MNVRLQPSRAPTGPAGVYKAGESFFEPPGSEHLISENASKRACQSARHLYRR